MRIQFYRGDFEIQIWSSFKLLSKSKTIFTKTPQINATIQLNHKEL